MAHYLSKRSQKKLKLARTKDLALLLLIAEQKGFFYDQGVEIEYVEVPYARKAMELLLAGQVDIATMVETNFAYLGYERPKIPFKAFTSVEKRTADNFILRGKDQSAKDLPGKKIGFTPRTTSHTFLVQFLKEQNINKGDIEIKPMSPQAMPNALMRGEIDGMSLWQPYMNNTMVAMDELDLPYTFFRNSGAHVSEVVLVASKTFLIKQRELLKGFLVSLKEAEGFLRKSPDMAFRILAEVMKLSGKTHAEALKQYTPELSLIQPSFLDMVGVVSDSIREYDTEFRGKPIPNYMDYIDNSYFLDVFSKK